MFPNFLKLKNEIDSNPPAIIHNEVKSLTITTSSDINELRSKASVLDANTQRIDSCLSTEISKNEQFLKKQEASDLVESKIEKSDNANKTRFDQLKNQLKLLDGKTGTAFTKADQALIGGVQANQKLRVTEQQLLSYINRIQLEDLRRNEALSGNIELKFEPVSPIEVSAAVLNAAAEGTLIQSLLVQLVSKLPDGEGGFIYPIHTWGTAIEPTITPGNTGCYDPTVTMDLDPEGTPVINSGVLQVSVTFATDEGSTKIYEAGDTVTVKVKIDASATRPWAAAEITMTYNVIA